MVGQSDGSAEGRHLVVRGEPVRLERSLERGANRIRKLLRRRRARPLRRAPLPPRGRGGRGGALTPTRRPATFRVGGARPPPRPPFAPSAPFRRRVLRPPRARRPPTADAFVLRLPLERLPLAEHLVVQLAIVHRGPPALTHAHLRLGVHRVSHPSPLARVPVGVGVRARASGSGEGLVVVVVAVVAVCALGEVLVPRLVAAPVLVEQTLGGTILGALVLLTRTFPFRVQLRLGREDVAPAGVGGVQLEVKVRVERVEAVHARVAQRTQPLVRNLVRLDRRHDAALVERAVAVPVANEDVVLVRRVAVGAPRAHHILDVNLAGVLLDAVPEADLAGVHVDVAKHVANL